MIVNSDYPIHPTAAKGFEIGADSYERGRPDFPKDAVDYLIRSLEIKPQSKVMDLGAGTGKFTRLLIPTKAVLTAVEPVEKMRQKFRSVLPEIEILMGTAENIPAPDSSFEAVVVAQAFHWFDGYSALKEIHRILKPNGKLGLIWNVRDESVDWVSELTRIVDAHEVGAPRYKTYEWKKAFDQTTGFTPLENRAFKYLQKGTAETVVDRVQSISYISALSEKDRENVLQQVRVLLNGHPKTKGMEKLEIPYNTDVYWCTKI
jgi:ubiquinone/menaquinone biosynthesis C-methylase UbiE